MEINPIRELLRACAIVGINPREATLNVLDQLRQDEHDFQVAYVTGELDA